jgi:hypothetical protein
MSNNQDDKKETNPSPKPALTKKEKLAKFIMRRKRRRPRTAAFAAFTILRNGLRVDAK